MGNMKFFKALNKLIRTLSKGSKHHTLVTPTGQNRGNATKTRTKCS